MVVDKLSELPKNNIGIAGSGQQKGYYIHVEKYTDTAWLLYWAKPYPVADNLKLGVDVGDDLLGNEEEALYTLNHRLQVDWLTGIEADRVYLQHFNLKESTPRRASGLLRSFVNRRFKKNK